MIASSASSRAAEALDHARRLRELAVEAKAKAHPRGISLEARTLEGFAKQYETEAAALGRRITANAVRSTARTNARSKPKTGAERKRGTS